MIRLSSDWYDIAAAVSGSGRANEQVAPLYEAARKHPASHDRTPATAAVQAPHSHLETASGRFLGVSSQLAPAVGESGRGIFSKGETR